MTGPNLNTAPGRVAAFLNRFASLGEPMSRTEVYRVSTADGDLPLTVADLRAVLVLADLGHHVIEHVYMNLDEDGELDPSTRRDLAEDVNTWREIERAWTWHPNDAPAIVQRLRGR